MKRERDNQHVLDRSISIANCLIFLSRAGQFDDDVDSYNHRVFECKTCNRQFPSFQALGGHRASHKKPRLAVTGVDEMNMLLHNESKPKTHECSICGMEFAIGQALGGHMRKHRSAATRTLKNNNSNNHNHINITTLSGGSDDSCLDSDDHTNSSSDENKRRDLFLDLNMTPSIDETEFINFI